jgi:excisionase family DNA binding protein
MTKLYTAAEVAALLRCDRRTVYNLVKADSIPYRRIGHLLRFEVAAIEQWVKGDPVATA